MSKPKNIDACFKRKDTDTSANISSSTSNPQNLDHEEEQCSSKIL